jgi:hypothetical protein
MRHSGWTFQTHCLGYSLEILAMTTKAVVYRMTELMNEGVK